MKQNKKPCLFNYSAIKFPGILDKLWSVKSFGIWSKAF